MNLDMEEYRDLDLTIDLFTRLLDEEEFRSLEAGIVLQAYLPDALPAMEHLIEWARRRRASGGAAIKIRLVKGANLAMEQVEAIVHGWAQAPYESKADGLRASAKRARRTLLDPQGRHRGQKRGMRQHFRQTPHDHRALEHHVRERRALRQTAQALRRAGAAGSGPEAGLPAEGAQHCKPGGRLDIHAETAAVGEPDQTVKRRGNQPLEQARQLATQHCIAAVRSDLRLEVSPTGRKAASWSLHRQGTDQAALRFGKKASSRAGAAPSACSAASTTAGDCCCHWSATDHHHARR